MGGGDGELEGRKRGWFPSNYVNAEMSSLTEEEPIGMKSGKQLRPLSNSSAYDILVGRTPYSQPIFCICNVMDDLIISYSRFSTWTRAKSISIKRIFRTGCRSILPSTHGTLTTRSSLCCIMPYGRTVWPIFNLLQHVLLDRVRSILASTETLQRDAPILQRFPNLGEERKQLLAILAALVAQTKKTSEGSLNDDELSAEVENMLRLGGQAFSHVRSFLTVAIKCGD